MAQIKVGRDHWALVDDADVPAVSAYRWALVGPRDSDIRYAIAKTPTGRVLMHRLLMGVAADKVVDHANRDGLDNRRANLRVCSMAENLRNRKLAKSSSSGLKGVSFEPVGRPGKPWRARITFDGVRRTLGMFETKESAYQAYCHAAKSLHGEFHRLA